mmetsp:Transcript_37116/g.97249  ORF Transcript_37116/g.97249 Transcript_37116/m.97249 type:complete len:260 (-) Transcript_37116:491-1270(-)
MEPSIPLHDVLLAVAENETHPPQRINNALSLPAVQGQRHTGQGHLVLPVQASHLPHVHQAQLAVLQQHHVARVRVPVEEARHKYLIRVHVPDEIQNATEVQGRAAPGVGHLPRRQNQPNGPIERESRRIHCRISHRQHRPHPPNIPLRRRGLPLVLLHHTLHRHPPPCRFVLQLLLHGVQEFPTPDQLHGQHSPAAQAGDGPGDVDLAGVGGVEHDCAHLAELRSLKVVVELTVELALKLAERSHMLGHEDAAEGEQQV